MFHGPTSSAPFTFPFVKRFLTSAAKRSGPGTLEATKSRHSTYHNPSSNGLLLGFGGGFVDSRGHLSSYAGKCILTPAEMQVRHGQWDSRIRVADRARSATDHRYPIRIRHRRPLKRGVGRVSLRVPPRGHEAWPAIEPDVRSPHHNGVPAQHRRCGVRTTQLKGGCERHATF
jgi:hypothetical protein